MRWVTEYFECSCSGLTEGDELLTTPSQRLHQLDPAQPGLLQRDGPGGGQAAADPQGAAGPGRGRSRGWLPRGGSALAGRAATTPS